MLNRIGRYYKEKGFASNLTRYLVPDHGVPPFRVFGILQYQKKTVYGRRIRRR
jgi:hypothetical protein